MIKLTIYGEPASKENSRMMAKDMRTGKLKPIKSEKARIYARDLNLQVPPLPKLLEGDLEFRGDLYYCTRRPDLDESLILDGLQGKVYKNDRQIKRKIVVHHIDKQNPRAEIEIREIEG